MSSLIATGRESTRSRASNTRARDTNRSFAWSLPNRLATSSDGTSYFYDGRKRRAQKTDGSGTTLYHYDPAGKLISETTATGQKLRDYIYLEGRLIAVDGCVSNAPPNCTDRQRLASKKVTLREKERLRHARALADVPKAV